MLILLLCLMIHTISTHCVLGENYWRQRSLEEWPPSLQNRTLCNETWFSLLRNTRNTTHWHRVFREICVAHLNKFTQGIEKAEEVLREMEHGVCGEERGREKWGEAWAIVLPRFMEEIRQFNRGLNPGHPFCPLTLSPSYNTSLVPPPSVVDVDHKFYIILLVLLTIFIVPLLVILTKRHLPRY